MRELSGSLSMWRILSRAWRLVLSTAALALSSYTAGLSPAELELPLGACPIDVRFHLADRLDDGTGFGAIHPVQLVVPDGSCLYLAVPVAEGEQRVRIAILRLLVLCQSAATQRPSANNMHLMLDCNRMMI